MKTDREHEKIWSDYADNVRNAEFIWITILAVIVFSCVYFNEG